MCNVLPQTNSPMHDTKLRRRSRLTISKEIHQHTPTSTADLENKNRGKQMILKTNRQKLEDQSVNTKLNQPARTTGHYAPPQHGTTSTARLKTRWNSEKMKGGSPRRESERNPRLG